MLVVVDKLHGAGGGLGGGGGRGGGDGGSGGGLGGGGEMHAGLPQVIATASAIPGSGVGPVNWHAW